MGDVSLFGLRKSPSSHVAVEVELGPKFNILMLIFGTHFKFFVVFCSRILRLKELVLSYMDL